jgi:GTP cyclohydrolase I
MTRDIADDIMRVLGAKGALVVTKAKHLCMCSRGPKDDNAVTIVTYGCRNPGAAGSSHRAVRRRRLMTGITEVPPKA